jgi:Ser/Thr protein kinase RdoA (MazF antagonist)
MPIAGKPLGLGNTADVYDAGDGRVLKLFHADYPLDAVQREYRNSLLVNTLDILAAKSRGMVTVESRPGILYDRIDGECMQDALFRTMDLEYYSTLLARIHKELLGHALPSAISRKERIRNNIMAAKTLGDAVKSQLAATLDRLPDGDAFCHGDFHFGNVLMAESGNYIIDYMDVCRGHAHGDIARTVYLIEMTPVPPGTQDRARMLDMKRLAADLYLREMGVGRDGIADWLAAVAAARLSELRSGSEEAGSILAYLSASGYRNG